MVESVREPIKVGAFLIIVLVAYIIYIFLLHPWERQAIVTKQASITVNVVDCESGYPIKGVKVSVFTEEGQVLSSGDTNDEGVFNFQTYPNCISIMATHGISKWEGMCLDSGVNRSASFCFKEPTAVPNILYYTEYLGVIGDTSGDIITYKKMGAAELSYPVINASIYYPDYYLLSNILWSERLSLKLNNVNETSTKQVSLEFNVESIRGEPKTRIWVNDELIAEKPIMSGDNVKVNVPKQLINETMLFDVSCTFTGWFFWTTQDCNLTDINITQEYYLPVKPVESLIFSTNNFERSSSLTSLAFYSDNNSSAPINITINGIKVFSSNSLKDKFYSGTVSTLTLNLTPDNNVMELSLGPGAEVLLKEMSLNFYAENVTTTREEFDFSITPQELITANEFKIRFYVSDIFLEGLINFQVNEQNYPKTIENAGWNELLIDISDLKDDNEIIITANGRFIINELMVSYEE